MTLITSHTIIAVLLSVILLVITQVLGGKFTNSRNKNRPFECGFDPKDSARLPFSIRFFLLAVVFLIFDIEVAILFPIILGVKLLILKDTYLAASIFLLVLILGLIHEWNQGSLRWVK